MWTTCCAHICVSIITKPQSHQSSVGTHREATHLSSITVCLTLTAQISLKGSSPAEDSPTVSHSLVFTKTLTFNGVLVILDALLVTVAVSLLHSDYSGSIHFNVNSHWTEIFPGKVLQKSPAPVCGVQIFFKLQNICNLSLSVSHTQFFPIAFTHTTSPPGPIIRLELLPLLGMSFR